MHYLSAENISKSYGIKPLFENISFNISEGDKIALVAKNGSGKTTMLKALAGKDTVDSGKIWIHKEVTVAYFDQDPIFEDSSSILDNIFNHSHPVLNCIKNYEAALEKNDENAIAASIELMDELSAWDFESKVQQILGKLQIHGLDKIVGLLSGGQKKRVALARTLIDIGFEMKHTLLIMDEPTNHLDVEMVEWLEHYLNQEKITLLLVTHDRYFLDNVCNTIWEMDGNQLYTHKGSYETYLEKKSMRIENQLASIDKAQNQYRKELEWMRKQPKARTTKSKSRIDAFADVENRAFQKIEDAQVQLQMKMSRLGGKIVEVKKVYKNFGEKKILSGFDYTFSKGERIGIVGKNGAGKTTFLNIIQGIEQADSGKINVGDTIVFGNFSQKGLIVNEDQRVIDFVKDIAENFPLANGGSLSAAQFLQLFLFSPEQQYTYVSKLSGGEKKRLHLLSVLFKNPNFLVLDEPTNDLDLQTLGVLENFLLEFPGCVIVVSHDRYFMDRLVDHIFVFEGDGVIKDYPGNYTQFRIWNKEQAKIVNEPKTTAIEEPTTVIVQNQTTSQSTKKLSSKEKKELENIEADIAKLEVERSILNEKIAANNIPFEQLQPLLDKLAEVSNTIETKEMRWMELL